MMRSVPQPRIFASSGSGSSPASTAARRSPERSQSLRTSQSSSSETGLIPRPSCSMNTHMSLYMLLSVISPPPYSTSASSEASFAALASALPSSIMTPGSPASGG